MIGAILLAGGKGVRMQSEIPKQFLLLKNKPIALFSYDVLVLAADFLVVVAPLEYRSLFPCKALFADPGSRRQDSVLNGLKALPECDIVLIHDAARPFIDRPLIDRTLEAAKIHGAACAGMPVKATIKLCDTNGFVKNTPNRKTVWEAQTPQAAKKVDLIRAFKTAQEITDDASLIESLNLPVKMVEGSYRNIKITTEDDLQIAKAFCA